MGGFGEAPCVFMNFNFTICSDWDYHEIRYRPTKYIEYLMALLALAAGFGAWRMYRRSGVDPVVMNNRKVSKRPGQGK